MLSMSWVTKADSSYHSILMNQPSPNSCEQGGCLIASKSDAAPSKRDETNTTNIHCIFAYLMPRRSALPGTKWPLSYFLTSKTTSHNIKQITASATRSRPLRQCATAAIGSWFTAPKPTGNKTRRI